MAKTTCVSSDNRRHSSPVACLLSLTPGSGPHRSNCRNQVATLIHNRVSTFLSLSVSGITIGETPLYQTPPPLDLPPCTVHIPRPCEYRSERFHANATNFTMQMLHTFSI